MQPSAWPNSWRTTREYSSASVSGSSQPKFIVGSSVGICWQTVPMYDHEPSSLKLIRIGASAASTNAKRMLATSSQPCATASTLRLLTASPSRNRQAIVVPGFHKRLGDERHPRAAEAARAAIERDGHQVVRAFGQRARIRRPPAGRPARTGRCTSGCRRVASSGSCRSSLAVRRCRVPGGVARRERGGMSLTSRARSRVVQSTHLAGGRGAKLSASACRRRRRIDDLPGRSATCRPSASVGKDRISTIAEGRA